MNMKLSSKSSEVFLILTTQLYPCQCDYDSAFSYIDKREVLQQEYSQPQILPSPHFQWVVNQKDYFILFPKRISFTEIHSVFVLTDAAKGFGGKFGVQKDRVDKSAVGWDHHEKVEKHASQKGRYSLGRRTYHAR